MQHGKAVSSASGSDEGARRQMGHAATGMGGASNSGVTSPRKARGAASAADTGAGGAQGLSGHQAREGQRGCPVRSLGKRVKKAAKEHGATCVKVGWTGHGARRRRSNASRARQAFAQRKARLRRLMKQRVKPV